MRVSHHQPPPPRAPLLPLLEGLVNVEPSREKFFGETLRRGRPDLDGGVCRPFIPIGQSKAFHSTPFQASLHQ